MAASILAKCPLRKEGRRTVKHLFRQGNTLVHYVHTALNKEYHQKPNFQQEVLAEADIMSYLKLLALIQQSESWEAITATGQETKQIIAKLDRGEVALRAARAAKEGEREGLEIGATLGSSS